ncbi:gasdermin [Streptomyces virginiae]
MSESEVEKLMVFCSDKTATYLAGLGYNVIRHPYADLRPPMVIGRTSAGTEWLGDLTDLVKDPQAKLPETVGPVPEADISGKSSSAMSFKVGTDLLSAFIGAMGGTLGAAVNYTDARTMLFKFQDVHKYQVKPAAVSDYIESGDLKWDSLLFRPYLEGEGQLFVVSNVATATSLTVSYERGHGTGAKVELEPLEDLLGATVDVSRDAGRAHEITYSGKQDVAFAFKCFEFGFFDGRPKLLNVKAGGVALDVEGSVSTDGYAARGEGVVLTTSDAPLLTLERREG